MSFLDTPKVKSSGINTGYFTGNQHERYIVLVQSFDKETLADVNGHVPSFYEGVITGILNAANTKGTLISKKDILINGVPSIQFEYKSTLDPKIPGTRFQQCIFYNNKLFHLCYWVFDGFIDAEQHKVRFFNSFQIAGKSDSK